MEDNFRVFAIENWHTKRKDTVVDRILTKLSLQPNDKVLIYVNAADYPDNKLSEYEAEISQKLGHAVTAVASTKETDGKNRATFKNFILKDCVAKFGQNENQYIYVFEDNIEILKDQTAFYNDIEKLMMVLNNNIWFSTVCDDFNYVFDKYDPRSKVCIDAKEFKDVYDGTICWCSHSVPQLLIARLTPDVKVEINAGLFDEDFYIPMFWILKYLATRRTKYSDRYYMNFYPTVLSENRTYRKIKDIDSEQIPKTLFEEEDVKFRKFNIDLTPNVNIDIVLKTIHERLLKVKEEK